MILPKELFEKIEYFEHTAVYVNGELCDLFTLHFRSWYRKSHKIKIRRVLHGMNEDGTSSWSTSPSAADLYNQLNSWAIQSWDEKLDNVKHKYEVTDGSNIIHLKPRPDMKKDDE